MHKLYLFITILLYLIPSNTLHADKHNKVDQRILISNTETPIVVLKQDTKPFLYIWKDGVFLRDLFPEDKDSKLIRLGRFEPLKFKDKITVFKNQFNLIKEKSYWSPSASLKSIYFNMDGKLISCSQGYALHWSNSINIDKEFRNFINGWRSIIGGIDSMPILQIYTINKIDSFKNITNYRGVNLEAIEKSNKKITFFYHPALIRKIK